MLRSEADADLTYNDGSRLEQGMRKRYAGYEVDRIFKIQTYKKTALDECSMTQKYVICKGRLNINPLFRHKTSLHTKTVS